MIQSDDKSRFLTDLEYLEQYITQAKPEELYKNAEDMQCLAFRNLSKISGTPEEHLRNRYVSLINSIIKYMPSPPLEKEPDVSNNIILPKRVQIEASTLCQLRCRAYGVQRNNVPVLGKGYLSFDNFKSFVDRHDFIKSIELSNNGEIFLNPDLKQIIRYAFENNIALTAYDGVNFNTVSDAVIEALVKYQFKGITFSIDGASQKTYSIYRINGNFVTVIRNIRKLNDYKKKYNSQLPKCKWQYILMEHNENDVIKAKSMAKELGLEIYFKLTYERDYKPQNIEMLKRETGLKYLSREEEFTSEGRPYGEFKACLRIWDNPQINWDGRFLGCSIFRAADYGVNVFEVGLENTLKSPNVTYAKEMLQGKVGIPDNTKNIPCANCKYYLLMAQIGKYLKLPKGRWY